MRTLQPQPQLQQQQQPQQLKVFGGPSRARPPSAHSFGAPSANRLGRGGRRALRRFGESLAGSSRQARLARRRCLRQGKQLASAVRAEFKEKGKRLLARDISVKQTMGQGSFGQVFEGILTTPSGGQERVVLKRVKYRVEGAKEMVEMEHLLNVYACKAAPDAVAEFIGYCGVSTQEANNVFTEGLWLIWKYEGEKTLHYYLRRRDCISALAMDMGISENAVVPTVMKQLLENLKALHAAGLVHRDVKPSNLIFVEKTRKFKLIDLGACADLRSGTNYVPGESILDPLYCPPEQHVLPTDGPELSRGMLSMAISPMLWARHMPDRFDMYSAGLILCQLAIPAMHKDSAMKAFRTQLGNHDYDLDSWRRSAVNLKPQHTMILDANDGAGWELMKALLRPRTIKLDDEGGVKFVRNEWDPRASAAEALKFSFLSKAVDNPSSPVSMWKTATRQLFDLESLILKQANKAEQQTTTVKKVRKEFAKGNASKEALEKEEMLLATMQDELKKMMQVFEDTSRHAFKALGAAIPSQSFLSSLGSMPKGEAPDKAAHVIEDNSQPFNFDWLVGKKTKTWREEVISETKEPSLMPRKGEQLHDPGSINLGISPTAAKKVAEVVDVGLKFTGLAARIATDLAGAIKNDVDSMFSELEEREMTKRKELQREDDFIQMLKAMKPELTSGSLYSNAVKHVRNDPRFLGVGSEARKITLFEKYVMSLKRKEEQERMQAEAALKAMYEDMNVGPRSSWANVHAQLRGTSVFEAVKSPGARQRIYDSVVAMNEMKLAQERVTAQVEADFKVMLTEMNIHTTSTWAKVRREMFGDPRCQPVPEARRKELFQEYHALVIEDESTGSVSQGRGNGAVAQSRMEDAAERSSKLMQLKMEQAKLLAEYAKMETRMKEMEARMEAKMTTESDSVSLNNLKISRISRNGREA